MLFDAVYAPTRKYEAMKIKSFEYKNLKTLWHLEKSNFSPYNLLVGVSGVGKSKILDSILRVCKSASSNTTAFREGAVWDMSFEHDEQLYRWEAKVTPAEYQYSELASDKDTSGDDDENTEKDPDRKLPEFTYEKITRNEKDILIERSEGNFSYEGAPLPKIKKTESALRLLAENEPIASIRAGLRKIIKIGHSVQHLYILTEPGNCEILENKYANSSAEDIRALKLDFTTKLYLLQKLHSAEYQNIKDTFCEIFDSVEDVKILKSSDLGIISDCPPPPKHLEIYYLAIKERGIASWISPANMSSGMFRSLMIVCQLCISPKGTVIIVDEMENSLGLNCIHKVASLMLSRAPDYQFIISSHHPYIINKIPIATWKLVTRLGYNVKLTDAQEVSNLQTQSHYDAFTRLINIKEYKQGIQ